MTKPAKQLFSLMDWHLKTEVANLLSEKNGKASLAWFHHLINYANP
jgi:hypothetical protein